MDKRERENRIGSPAGWTGGTMGDDDLPRWELFEHGADIGVRGVAASAASAFEQAALAMVAVAVDPARVRAETPIAIHCDAPDIEILLVDWLNAIVYEMATLGMVFGRFEVALADLRLAGRAFGEPLDKARHQPAVEVKGATYTALAVYHRNDGAWVAQCVVDV